MNFNIDFKKLCAMYFLNLYYVSHTSKNSLSLGKGRVKPCMQEKEIQKTGLNGPHFLLSDNISFVLETDPGTNSVFLAS